MYAVGVNQGFISAVAILILFGFVSIVEASACERNLVNDKDRLFRALSIPSASLLEIRAGEIRIITAEGKASKIRDRSGDYIEVYELIESQLIMKKIVFGNLGSTSFSLSERLYDHIDGSVIVKGNRVWELRGQDLVSLDCSTRNGFFERISAGISRFKRGKSGAVTMEHGDLYRLLLTDPDKLLSIKENVVVQTDVVRDKDFQQIIEQKRLKNSKFENRIDVQHQSLGVQRVGVSLPATELDTAKSMQDTSALFYLSDFHRLSDEVTSSPFVRFQFGTELGDGTGAMTGSVYASFGQGPFIQSALRLDADSLEIDQALAGFELQRNSDGFAKFRFGQFDDENTGFLASAYKPDGVSDKLYSLQAYFGADQTCDSCLQTSISLGVQEYRANYGGYWGTAFNLEKTEQGVSKSSQFTFEKPLTRGGRLQITGVLDLGDANNYGLSISAEFPLSYSKTKYGPAYVDGRVQASTGRRSPLSTWTQMDRDIFFSNTKSTLQRNWKSYMSLDQ